MPLLISANLHGLAVKLPTTATLEKALIFVRAFLLINRIKVLGKISQP
jgi:hypothetical protein